MTGSDLLKALEDGLELRHKHVDNIHIHNMKSFRAYHVLDDIIDYPNDWKIVKSKEEMKLETIRGIIEKYEFILKTKDELLANHRLQKRPSEALWKRIEKANNMWKEIKKTYGIGE